MAVPAADVTDITPDNPDDTTELESIESRVQSDTTQLSELARILVVRTQDQAEKATALVRAVAGKRREIEAWFKEPVEAAHRAHKSLTVRHKAALDKLTKPEGAFNVPGCKATTAPVVSARS